MEQRTFYNFKSSLLYNRITKGRRSINLKSITRPRAEEGGVSDQSIKASHCSNTFEHTAVSPCGVSTRVLETRHLVVPELSCGGSTNVELPGQRKVDM